jgi:hypothetical protein
MVPNKAFRSLDAIPQNISRSLPLDIPFHGLLAAALTLDKTSKFTPWSAVFPTLADFEANSPFMWPEELQNLLPKPAKDILNKLHTKFEREWNMVTKSFPQIHQKEYLRSWLIVNTRTFYFESPKMERYLYDDRLALLPVADLFNHADSGGCQVSYSTERFIFKTERPYSAGEEVHICYGSHTNDFLLAEYGFTLTTNRWDAVCLDEVILPQLNKIQKAKLEDRGYLGKYILDLETAGCHRTQVVLRLMCCTPKQWRSFVDAEDDGEGSQRKANALLTQFLETFSETISTTIGCVEKQNESCQGVLLIQRWKQIRATVMLTITRLQS